MNEYEELKKLDALGVDSIETSHDASSDVTPKKRRLPLWRLLWRIVWITALSIALLAVAVIFVYKYINPPMTPLMVQRFFQQLGDSERKVNFERDYVSLDDISPNLVSAVVASEDGNFMRHKGFDIGQLKQTYRENQRGRRVRGGSTISMQTAKNAFLPHRRNYLRKAVEAGYTMAIEKVWGKKRIMEVYLNIIEFGDGIYGCEAAAQHYFGHSAKTLSRHEAAQLAVSLPSPLKRNPEKATPYFRRQTSVIEARMAKYGRVNLDNPPKNRRPEDEEDLFDFLRWVKEQKKAEKK